MWLELFKKTAYSLAIIVAASLAMVYPDGFKQWGDFETKRLIVPLLQVIMFGMGTAVSLRDFLGVVKMPKGVAIGVLCQFTIMPLLGLSIARGFGFEPEIAAGVLLVGCAPCGLASNVMSYLARGNVALSVTLTVVGTALAPVVTPALMSFLGGTFIAVDFWAMMWDICKIVILPVAAGLVFHHFCATRFGALLRAMPFVSMAGIAVIICVITANGRESLLTVGPWLVLACFLHNTGGYFLGYWGARLFRMGEQDCRTVAIEVGMQNAGLASGLAMGMGKIATVGLAPAVFGPMMNISGSCLAMWWRGRPPEGITPDCPQQQLPSETTTPQP